MSACPVDTGERSRCVPAEGGSLTIAIGFGDAHCGFGGRVTAPDWLTPAASASADLLFTAAPNPGARRTGIINMAGQAIRVTQSGKEEPPLACVGQRGVVNAADYDARPVVPGSHVAVFGDNLGDAATSKVLVNGKPVAVEFAAAHQINFVLPSTIPIGTNHLNIEVNGTTGPETNFWVTEAMAAIFADSAGHAIAVNADQNTLNSPESPVHTGRPLTLYLTGVGATNSDALHSSKFTWTAAVDGYAADRLFLGLAPGFTGVYQANIGVPASLDAGDHRVTFTVNGVTSRPALVSVAQ
jgi:uncharacterized protein (TIGR03437 family)